MLGTNFDLEARPLYPATPTGDYTFEVSWGLDSVPGILATTTVVITVTKCATTNLTFPALADLTHYIGSEDPVSWSIEGDSTK